MSTSNNTGKLRTKHIIKLVTPSGGHMDLELKAGTPVETLILEMLTLIPKDRTDVFDTIEARLQSRRS